MGNKIVYGKLLNSVVLESTPLRAKNTSKGRYGSLSRKGTKFAGRPRVKAWTTTINADDNMGNMSVHIGDLFHPHLTIGALMHKFDISAKHLKENRIRTRKRIDLLHSSTSKNLSKI